MASSEVDQKFLGHFAKTTSIENNYLSSFLFRVLGLSVILAEKLLRARKTRRLDPVRNPKDKHLVYHILWLAREGLVMVEQYVLPMVGNYVELKVLAYKLRASFHHIFVLFHNNPPVNDRINRSRSGSGGGFSLYPDPLLPRTRSSSSRDLKSPTSRQRSPAISLGGPVKGSSNFMTKNPPGLPIPSHRNNSTGGRHSAGDATFLLPPKDFTIDATKAFESANALAESLLPGSHPIRLSVKVEYVAYLYDCLSRKEQSRYIAKQSIREVYAAQEGMDDESYEDAAEMVGMLGRMMRRGLPASTGSTGSAVPAGSTATTLRQQQTSRPATTATSTTAGQPKQESTTSGSSRSSRGRRGAGGTGTTGTGGTGTGTLDTNTNTTYSTQPTTWV